MKINLNNTINILCCLLCFISNKLNANQLDFTKLYQEQLDLTCINYQPNGLCFWLKCTPFGCSVKTSVLIEHYTPDYLVETIQNKNNPLGMLTNLYPKLSKNLGPYSLGVGNNDPHRQKINNLQFIDIAVVGNPLIHLVELFAAPFATLGWCKSPTSPSKIYFHSKVDPEWRIGVYERIATLDQQNLAQISSSSVYWGKIYPRMGWVNNSVPYRNHATIAHRAFDILANNKGMHLIQKIPNKPLVNQGFGENKFKIGDPSFGTWQLNYPHGKRSGCYIFPDKKNYPYSLIN